MKLWPEVNTSSPVIILRFQSKLSTKTLQYFSPEGCRLPGSVDSQQAETFIFPHTERQAAHSFELVELLGQIYHLEIIRV